MLLIDSSIRRPLRISNTSLISLAILSVASLPVNMKRNILKRNSRVFKYILSRQTFEMASCFLLLPVELDGHCHMLGVELGRKAYRHLLPRRRKNVRLVQLRHHL